ncbi:MAG TPA: hypothetical protein DD381_01525 [Lentisphaeria bacterium]|nr:MAG: hypothetical protein A2X47_10505 [Lentisphaerae bacterium GWF2_38_69]HBM15023.1 hypothetical protein [Lentisphaeria bacterium]
MSILHTKFLVHWTGKDFHIDRNNLTDQDRKKYVDRLKDILDHGFYMNKGSEMLWDTKDQWIQAKIARTCFTEIKLSLARKHAERYGLLGIRVDRNFILERYGNPVFYQYNGKFNCIAENLRLVRDYLEKRDETEKKSNEESWLRKLEVILVYCKNMNERDVDEYPYYDELEWRIIDFRKLLDEEKIKQVGKDKNGNSVFRILLKPEDIKIMVFPDDKTRDMALLDNFIRDSRRKNWIITTLDDCEHF